MNNKHPIAWFREAENGEVIASKAHYEIEETMTYGDDESKMLCGLVVREVDGVWLDNGDSLPMCKKCESILRNS